MTRALHVMATGPLTTVQDLGRPGWAHLGVGRAGAADLAAHRLANRLVGTHEGAATLEVTYGGLAVCAEGHLSVCVTGAPAPLTVDGSPVPDHAPLVLRPGQLLALGTPASGLRSYLAVRGGIDVPPVLGSRSRDTLAALGPEPLAVGDRLAAGELLADYPAVDRVVARPASDPAGMLTVRVRPGPRHDWFADPAALAAGSWAVTERADRVGVRLQGTPLERAAAARGAELPSEPMVRGCVQVPPNGQPVVFGNDHPVTGGYPVIGVVDAAGMDRLLQLPPGSRVVFRWQDVAMGTTAPSPAASGRA